DVAVVGDRLAAPALDDAHHNVRVPAAALAGHRRAEVVHHDGGAVRGQFERVRPADPVAGAGHEGDFAFKQGTHETSSLMLAAPVLETAEFRRPALDERADTL